MNGKRFLIGWGSLTLFFLLGLAVVGRVPSKDPRTLLLRPVAGDGVDAPGDYYLMVQFDLGTIDLSRVEWDGTTFFPGQSVYVVLSRRNDTPRAVRVLSEPPDRGFFLRGVAAGRTQDRLDVLYGVESFTVPENARADFDAFPRPFDVRIRVDDGGVARVVALVAGGKTLPLSL